MYENIPRRLLLPLSARERRKLESLIQRPSMPHSWGQQLRKLRDSGHKAEIECLSSSDGSIDYLANTYLPRKLARADWLPPLSTALPATAATGATCVPEGRASGAATVTAAVADASADDRHVPVLNQ